MERRIITFVFALLCFVNLTAQTDKTATILSSNQNDETKVKSLNKLASELIEEKLLNEADGVVQKAMEIATLKSLPAGKADAMDNLGLLAQNRFDYTNAMNFFVQSLKIKDGLNNPSGVAIAKNHIGKIFFLQKNEENALTNYKSALALLQNNGDKAALAETHRNLGDLYLAKKTYGTAKEHYDTALRIWAEEVQDLKKAAGIASYLGKVVTDLGDNDGAMTYFNASLNFHRNLNDIAGIGNDYLNLSKIYNSLNDSELAFENVNNALAAFQQINNKLGIAESYHLSGKLSLAAGNRGQAESFFDKSADLLKGTAVEPGIPEILKSISLSFAEMGNYPKAYTMAQAFDASKDQLFNRQKAESLLELTTKYESEYAVKDKNRQLATMSEQRATEQMIRWLLIALVLSAIVAMFFVYKSYKQKKADNEKLTAMNETIQSQNGEIARKNIEMNVTNLELKEKNGKLDHLNDQLVFEISERENSQKSLFSKDHYLASVTTRMRNPLNEIVGLAQALMSSRPRHDQKDSIQNLQFATNNLLVLINDVLDFSEIEASKISLETIDFSTEDIVTVLKKDIKSDKNIRVEFNVDKRIPESLNGDAVRLNQILNYLLKNQYDKIDEGYIETNILRSELIDNELTLKVDIHAKGSKITYELLDRLYNKPSNRDELENLAEDEVELVIARRLVELQNGTISVSKVKEEVITTLFLPFKVVDEKKLEKNTEGPNVPAFNDNFLEGKRILVVEDNKVNQMLVVNMLKKKGMIVSAANDGLEGLEAVQMKDFDLILMDIQMPRMDGYRAVAEIRRLKEPSKSDLPIIALTASAYVTEKEKAQLFGMTDHIGKPFSPEEMIEKISRVLMTHNPNEGSLAVQSVN
jgi:CheY-like chemotaxis protein